MDVAACGGGVARGERVWVQRGVGGGAVRHAGGRGQHVPAGGGPVGGAAGGGRLRGDVDGRDAAATGRVGRRAARLRAQPRGAGGGRGERVRDGGDEPQRQPVSGRHRRDGAGGVEAGAGDGGAGQGGASVRVREPRRGHPRPRDEQQRQEEEQWRLEKQRRLEKRAGENRLMRESGDGELDRRLGDRPPGGVQGLGWQPRRRPQFADRTRPQGDVRTGRPTGGG